MIRYIGFFITIFLIAIAISAFHKPEVTPIQPPPTQPPPTQPPPTQPPPTQPPPTQPPPTQPPPTQPPPTQPPPTSECDRSCFPDIERGGGTWIGQFIPAEFQGCDPTTTAIREAEYVFFDATDDIKNGVIFIIASPDDPSPLETTILMTDTKAVVLLTFDWACVLPENNCEPGKASESVIDESKEFFNNFTNTWFENGKQMYRVTLRTEDVSLNPGYVNRVLIRNKTTGEYIVFYENFFSTRSTTKLCNQVGASTRIEFFTNDIPIIDGIGFDKIHHEVISQDDTIKYLPHIRLFSQFEPVNAFIAIPNMLNYTLETIFDSYSWRARNKCCIDGIPPPIALPFQPIPEEIQQAIEIQQIRAQIRYDETMRLMDEVEDAE
jgi:hypothetical protein